MKLNKYIVATAILFSTALATLAKIPLSVSLPKQARPGESVTVCVKTERDAKCKIEAQDAGITQALNLTDQTADITGKATWQFKLPSNYRANEMPVTITVSKDANEEKLTKTISVKK